MLVLSRMKDEVICIGEDIKVVVLGVSGKRVRLGIAAPDNISIQRLEVQKRIDAEGLAASRQSLDSPTESV